MVEAVIARHHQSFFSPQGFEGANVKNLCIRSCCSARNAESFFFQTLQSDMEALHFGFEITNAVI